MSLSGIGDWEVVAPQQAILPLAPPEDLRLMVRRVPLETISGRVVTPTHQPLAGVIVRARIQPRLSSGSPVDEREVTSDAAGLFTVSNLRVDADVMLSCHSPGYRYLTGGQVVRREGVLQAQDLVLLPLSARIAGSVVFADGRPAAGALLLSPDGDSDSRAITDAAGRFVLPSLPEGAVTVLAGATGALAEAREVQGPAPIRLTLQPVARLATPDAKRAFDVLEEAWATTAPQDPARAELPAALAPYAPDLALKLVTGPDGVVDESALTAIIVAVAAGDPVRAAQWGPAQLSLLRHPEMLFEAHAALVVALANATDHQDLAQAHELYRQAVAYAKAQDLTETAAASRAVALVQAALALADHGEAAFWSRQALTAAGAPDANRAAYDSAVDSAVVALAGVGVSQAEPIVDSLPLDRRLAILQRVVREQSAVNSELARVWLRKLVAVDPDATQAAAGPSRSGAAAAALIEAVGKADPSGALTAARSVMSPYDRPGALALAALYQPAALAVPVAREAAALAAVEDYDLPVATARLAVLVSEVDLASGGALFAAARRRLEESEAGRDDDGADMAVADDGIAAFGYYYARVDSAFSRLLLEAEFARLRHRQVAPSDTWRVTRLKTDIAEAMVASDVQRALEMVALLPPDNIATSHPQLEARRAIAQYLLLSERERTRRAFKEWQVSDSAAIE